MQQNYLHGETAPQINAFLAATAWNLQKLMNKLVKDAKKYFFRLVIADYWHGGRKVDESSLYIEKTTHIH
jgi:hypothetical protein